MDFLFDQKSEKYKLMFINKLVSNQYTIYNFFCLEDGNIKNNSKQLHLCEKLGQLDLVRCMN